MLRDDIRDRGLDLQGDLVGHGHTPEIYAPLNVLINSVPDLQIRTQGHKKTPTSAGVLYYVIQLDMTIIN
jgi:hypothetical protein